MHGSSSIKPNKLTFAILEITRPMMIVAALYARRPSFMTQSQRSATTMSISNDDLQPSSGSALAYLLDTLAQTPALYTEYNAIVSAESTKATNEQDILPSVQTLLSRALSLKDDMSFQKMYWRTCNPIFEFSSILNTITTSTSPYPYPYNITLNFLSLQTANVSTFSAAITIILNQLIVSSLPLLPSDHDIQSIFTVATSHTSAAITHITEGITYHE